MKLSRIPVSESTVKHTFALKQSTCDLLQKYQACYKAQHNVDISMKDMVEAMLTGFMAEDKGFQKFLKAPTARDVAPAAAQVVSQAPADTEV